MMEGIGILHSKAKSSQCLQDVFLLSCAPRIELPSYSSLIPRDDWIYIS